MEHLPQDPVMLVSYINMKLRDTYSSLEDLCDDLNISQDELVTTLANAGFEYSSENKRFW
jgi:hypothetical protein